MNIRVKGAAAAAVPLLPSLLGILVTSVALVAADRALDAAHAAGISRIWTSVVAGAVVAAVAAPFRARLYRWLVSVPFSIAILGAILIATALGTFVVQGAPPEELQAKFGPAFAGALSAAGVDDIFHSFAFRGLLALLALALLLTIIDRRGWRAGERLFSLNHLSVVVILTGGLIGNIRGLKGFIDLHEGQTARSFVLRDNLGKTTSEKIPLDFGLRLDKFEIDRLPPEYRLYVYRKSGAGYQPLSSKSMEGATAWTGITDLGAEWRLTAVYPDFEMKVELRDLSDGHGGPAMLIHASDKDGKIFPLVLLAGVSGRDAVLFPESRTLLRFVWVESAIPDLTESKPERHSLSIKQAGSLEAFEEWSVTPGESRTLGDGTEIRVLAWYPDFTYNGKTREASTRSSEPRNPALRISVRSPGSPAEEQFLFANNHAFSSPDGTPVGGLLFKYGYEAAHKPAERDVVVVGATGEILDYRHGVLAERAKLPEKREDYIARGVRATIVRASACAEEAHVPITRSRKWKNPVAAVELRRSGTVETEYVKVGMPLDLGNGEDSLVFQPKPDDVKTYRSEVSVLKPGEKAVKETISVNHALSVDGYRLYQSNYRKDDPTYSGILVVKDPGLPWVYAGFVLLCVGAVARFYIHPWLLRRRLPSHRPAPAAAMAPVPNAAPAGAPSRTGAGDPA